MKEMDMITKVFYPTNPDAFAIRIHDYTRNVTIEIDRMGRDDVSQLSACIDMGCYTSARELLVKWEDTGKYTATLYPLPVKPRDKFAIDYRNMYDSNAKVITKHFKIKHVSFKDRTTIVVWHDGTVTKVTASEVDEFNREVGIAMCIAKRAYENLGVDGGKSKFNDIINNAIKTAEEEEQKKLQKEYKRNLAKARNEAKEIKEKAKSEVAVLDLSKAWCHIKDAERKEHISITFLAKNDAFDRAIVRDYGTLIEYEVFEYESAMWIKRMLNDNDYAAVRKWLGVNFEVNVEGN